jgi:hypothetical protein
MVGADEQCSPVFPAARTASPDDRCLRDVAQHARNDSPVGREPHAIEYLKALPSREAPIEPITAMRMSPRGLRREGTFYDALGLDEPNWTDKALIDLVPKHPEPINRADRCDAPLGSVLPGRRKPCSRSCSLPTSAPLRKTMERS